MSFHGIPPVIIVLVPHGNASVKMKQSLLQCRTVSESGELFNGDLFSRFDIFKDKFRI